MFHLTWINVPLVRLHLHHFVIHLAALWLLVNKNKELLDFHH